MSVTGRIIVPTTNQTTSAGGAGYAAIRARCDRFASEGKHI